MSRKQAPHEALFIQHMPQVSIDVVDGGLDIEINVSSINPDFETVGNTTIRFPIDLALQIGEALVSISKGKN